MNNCKWFLVERFFISCVKWIYERIYEVRIDRYTGDDDGIDNVLSGNSAIISYKFDRQHWFPTKMPQNILVGGAVKYSPTIMFVCSSFGLGAWSEKWKAQCSSTPPLWSDNCESVGPARWLLGIKYKKKLSASNNWELNEHTAYGNLYLRFQWIKYVCSSFCVGYNRKKKCTAMKYMIQMQ